MCLQCFKIKFFHSFILLKLMHCRIIGLKNDKVVNKVFQQKSSLLNKYGTFSPALVAWKTHCFPAQLPAERLQISEKNQERNKHRSFLYMLVHYKIDIKPLLHAKKCWVVWNIFFSDIPCKSINFPWLLAKNQDNIISFF